MNEASMYGSGRGNTVCHLNTDTAEVSLSGNSSGGSVFGVDSEGVRLSCKVREAGREGKGPGELAGDKGSKPKEEHSGSGTKESDFIAVKSEGSVEDSVMVCVFGEFRAGNTMSRGGDKIGDKEEVARVDEIIEEIDLDNPRLQNGLSETGNTAVASGTAGSEPLLSASEMKPKMSPVGSFEPAVATTSTHDGLEG